MHEGPLVSPKDHAAQHLAPRSEPMARTHSGGASSKFNRTSQRLTANLESDGRLPSTSTPFKSGSDYDFSQIRVHSDATLQNQRAMAAGSKTMDMEGPVEEDPTVLSDDDGGAAPAVAGPDAGVGGPAVGAQPAVPAQVAPGPPGGILTVGPTVTLPTHIRSTSSPVSMPDRIPPRVDTAVAVGISGLTIPMRDITLSIEGAGSGNGTVTINGAASVDLGASATVQLRGVDQTAVGKAGNLRLVASQGGIRLAASASFSVSSIPENWSVTLVGPVTGTERGIDVNNNWVSDSGNVADLDQAERSEQVQYGVGTGCFAGVTGNNSGFRRADSPPLVDHHAAPVALLTGPGRILAEQTFIFNDFRSGATNIPARNSGYRLSREVTQPTPGNLQIVTTKTGTATSANGFASAAGAGSATSGAQAV